MPWSESIRDGSAGRSAPRAGGVTTITDVRQMHCAESQPRSTMYGPLTVSFSSRLGICRECMKCQTGETTCADRRESSPALKHDLAAASSADAAASRLASAACCDTDRSDMLLQRTFAVEPCPGMGFTRVQLSPLDAAATAEALPDKGFSAFDTKSGACGGRSACPGSDNLSCCRACSTARHRPERC